MSDTTNLIVTEDDIYGLMAESPQHPGFVYGRPTLTEFSQDYRSAIDWAGIEPPIIGHQQRRFETPEGVEFVVRFAEDQHRPERILLAQRVLMMMGTDQRHDVAKREQPDSVGEYVFICCLSSDAVRFVTDQMRKGDTVIIAMDVAEVGVWMMQLTLNASAGWDSIELYGWTLDTTIGEMAISSRKTNNTHPRLAVSV